jgi:hypothetical protein
MTMIPPGSTGLTQPATIDEASMFPPLDIQSSERIAQLARMHLRDFPMPFQARVNTNGVSFRYELPVGNIDPDTFQVAVTTGTTSAQLVMNTDYTLDQRQGILYLTNVPVAQQLLVASGQYMKSLLPGELGVYVQTALLQHNYGVDPPPVIDVWPTPVAPVSGYGTAAPIPLPPIEEYPVSYLVASLALWDLAIEAAQEHDIRTPDGVIISRGQIFQQIMGIIPLVEGKYREMCSIFNIGMYRIEARDLRRVSRTTNRYVPVYRNREYDDWAWAQRELPARDVIARTITDRGFWNSTLVYKKDDIVTEGTQRYIALQPVPVGKDPALDVNPTTQSGFFWAMTTVGTFPWSGSW